MLVKTSNAQTEETFKEPKYDSKGGGGRLRLLGGSEIWDEREKKIVRKKKLFFLFYFDQRNYWSENSGGARHFKRDATNKDFFFLSLLLRRKVGTIRYWQKLNDELFKTSFFFFGERKQAANALVNMFFLSVIDGNIQKYVLFTLKKNKKQKK